MILTFDKAGSFFNGLRNLFSGIDSLVYSLIAWILKGIFEISRLTANPSLVELIYRRIYVVLAIFMVFKLSFSFISYLINPDSMNDKEKGVAKLISRTIVMLALLIMLPILLFGNLINDEQTILNALQTGVLNTLPRIILGIETKNPNSVGLDADKAGEFLSIKMLESFYYPAECNSESPAYRGIECEDTEMELSSLGEFRESITERADTGGVYKYQYMWPLTLIAGIALVVILLGFAVDIAVRSFKLIVLQMIAPIPVMSYIDPKASKDGAFSQWLKSYASTYIEIFTKLGSIYLLLLLLEKLFTSDDSQRLFTGMSGGFLKVFMIIGLFQFVKQAPKFIKDALGMKDSGGSMFGGLKSLGAAAGLVGGATAGLVGGAVGGAVSGVRAAQAAGGNTGKKVLSGIGHGLTGAMSGLGRGGAQGFKGAGKGNVVKGIAGVVSSQSALNQKKISAASEGSTVLGRMQARRNQFFGLDSEVKTRSDNSQSLLKAANNAKKLQSHFESKGYTKLAGANIGTSGSYKDIGGRDVRSVTRKAGDHLLFKNLFEHESSHGSSSLTFHGTTYDMATAGKIYADLNKQTAKAYQNEVAKGSIDDQAAQELIDTINQDISAVNSKNIGSVTSIDLNTFSKDTEDILRTQGNSIRPSDAELSATNANYKYSNKNK